MAPKHIPSNMCSADCKFVANSSPGTVIGGLISPTKVFFLSHPGSPDHQQTNNQHHTTNIIKHTTNKNAHLPTKKTKKMSNKKILCQNWGLFLSNLNRRIKSDSSVSLVSPSRSPLFECPDTADGPHPNSAQVPIRSDATELKGRRNVARNGKGPVKAKAPAPPQRRRRGQDLMALMIKNGLLYI